QCVLDSIVKLSPASLFNQPLLDDQAFPRLYLWAVQQFSSLFNHHLLSLRLFSFLAMLAAFGVWLKIARRILDHPLDLILFIGCWCASMPLVYYAAELKPYSMDVLASGLIVLYLLEQDTVPLFLLPLLALFSYPAAFLLLLPLYNLARASLEQR